MPDFLAEMADSSYLRARATRDRVGAGELEANAASAPPPVSLKLPSAGFDVIAEAKLASPSEGRLVDGDAGSERVASLATAFSSHGAVAVSVLTEPAHFAGSLDHLRAAAVAVSIPVMRKDFLVDPIQVLEARAAGASGVLLIARMLTGESLAEMTDLAIELGMFVLVEVFDRSDLNTAVKVFDRDVLVGVNCRDLTTLGVDKERLKTLVRHLPDHLPTVAESGMTTPQDVAGVASLGYRLALVGSSLVSDADPAGKLTELLEAGRDASTGVSP